MPLQDGAVKLAQRIKVDMLALNIQKLLGKFSSAFCGIGLSVLLGVDPTPKLQPFQSLLADNRLGAAILVALIAIIGVGSFLITSRSAKNGKNAKKNAAQHPVTHIFRVLAESLVEIIIGFLAGLFLGVGTVPSSIPLIALIRQHPPIGIGAGGVLLLVLILAPLIGEDETESEDDEAEEGAHKSLFAHSSARIWFASATSLTSLALLFALMGMVTIRPSWCPTSICPAPQQIVVTNKHGVHDGVMESYYLAQQSVSYALTQDPSSYTFSNLPNTVGAVELAPTATAYRAVIGIHSLQRNTRYGLIIDGVDVIIDKATPIDAPVNVFVQGTNLVYNNAVYTFTYIHQPAPATLPATPPKVTIGLEVGGSDELSVQIVSFSEVALQFHLEVHYHQIVGGAASKSLIIPHQFAVDFIAPEHWKRFVFAGDKMVAQP